MTLCRWSERPLRRRHSNRRQNQKKKFNLKSFLLAFICYAQSALLRLGRQLSLHRNHQRVWSFESLIIRESDQAGRKIVVSLDSNLFFRRRLKRRLCATPSENVSRNLDSNWIPDLGIVFFCRILRFLIIFPKNYLLLPFMWIDRWKPHSLFSIDYFCNFSFHSGTSWGPSIHFFPPPTFVTYVHTPLAYLVPFVNNIY